MISEFYQLNLPHSTTMLALVMLVILVIKDDHVCGSVILANSDKQFAPVVRMTIQPNLELDVPSFWAGMAPETWAWKWINIGQYRWTWPDSGCSNPSSSCSSSNPSSCSSRVQLDASVLFEQSTLKEHLVYVHPHSFTPQRASRWCSLST